MFRSFLRRNDPLYRIHQNFYRPRVFENIVQEGPKRQRAELTWTHLEGSDPALTFSTKGVGKVRQDARKVASQQMVALLKKGGLLLPEEQRLYFLEKNDYDSVRGRLRAEERVDVTNETPTACEVRVVWTVQGHDFEEVGSGNSRDAAVHAAKIKLGERLAERKQDLRDERIDMATREKVVAQKTLETDLRKARSDLLSPLTGNQAEEVMAQFQGIATNFYIQSRNRLVPCAEGWSCCFEWKARGQKWKSVMRMGHTALTAKAECMLHMLEEEEFAEAIPLDVRKRAKYILDQLHRHTKSEDGCAESKEGLDVVFAEACAFLRESEVSAWQLFLPQVWQHAVRSASNAHMENLIRAVGMKPLQPFLWERLLDDTSFGMEIGRRKRALRLLHDLPMDIYQFHSGVAAEYYQKYRSLLAGERLGNIANALKSPDAEIVHTNIESCALPFLTFSSDIDSFPYKDGDFVAMYITDHHDLDIHTQAEVALNEFDENAPSGVLGTIVVIKKEDKVGLRIASRVSPQLIAHFTKDSLAERRVSLASLEVVQVTMDRMSRALSTLTGCPRPRSEPPNKDIAFSPIVRDAILTPSSVFSSASTLNDIKKNGIKNEAAGEEDAYLDDLALSDVQNSAVKRAVTRKGVQLVQGPPGTGKTHTACAIIDRWRRDFTIRASDGKILACADSNVAADNLAIGLRKRGVRCVRVGAQGAGGIVGDEDLKTSDLYADYEIRRRRGKAVAHMRQSICRDVVQKASVIVATCSTSGHEMFDGMNFTHVLVDECTQAIEPATLIALSRKAEQVVLIGDHKQLPPTLLGERNDLAISMFERLASTNLAKDLVLLNEQRRMHPDISIFPNKSFYDGKLEDFVSAEERPPIKGMDWPNRVMFFDVANGQMEDVGTSRKNETEAHAVISLVKRFLSSGVPASEIAILTPYRAQRRFLSKQLSNLVSTKADTTSSASGKGGSSDHHIEINTVDGFQGMEQELIIFSAVRTGGQLGFLADARRANVMLTRARRGVIVVGDKATLTVDGAVWRPWVEHLEERGAVLDWSAFQSGSTAS